MKSYTVHQPVVPALDADKRAEELIFVREGFSWWAFLLPVVWLLYHRLWLSFLVVLILTFIINAGTSALGVSQIFATLAFLFLSLVVAFEGHNLKRWHLDMADYRFVGAVSGSDLYECERKFFAFWEDDFVKGAGAQDLKGASTDRSSDPLTGSQMSSLTTSQANPPQMMFQDHKSFS